METVSPPGDAIFQAAIARRIVETAVRTSEGSGFWELQAPAHRRRRRQKEPASSQRGESQILRVSLATSSIEVHFAPACTRKNGAGRRKIPPAPAEPRLRGSGRARCFAPDKLAVPKETGENLAIILLNLDLAISATSVMHCMTVGTRCPKGPARLHFAGRRIWPGRYNSKLGRPAYEMCWVGANDPHPVGRLKYVLQKLWYDRPVRTQLLVAVGLINLLAASVAVRSPMLQHPHRHPRRDRSVARSRPAFRRRHAQGPRRARQA